LASACKKIKIHQAAPEKQTKNDSLTTDIKKIIQHLQLPPSKHEWFTSTILQEDNPEEIVA
jgi:hypothetical protein